jgi:hypothetical protein
VEKFTYSGSISNFWNKLFQKKPGTCLALYYNFMEIAGGFEVTVLDKVKED